MNRFDRPAACTAVQSPLRVSVYDRLHAMLTATVMVGGALVLILLAAWLASFDISASLRQATLLIGQPAGEHATNLAALDLPDLPAASQNQLEQQLHAMQDLPSSVLLAAAAMDVAGQGDAGLPGGIGEQRIPGTPGVPDDVIPEWQRWQIQYSPPSAEHYMAILQAFNITIGAVHQTSNRIYLVSDLTNDPGTIATTDRSHAELYFFNQNRRLRNWDRAMVESAGVDVETDYLLVHFYPAAVRERFRELENTALLDAGTELREIERIVFRVRPAADAFEYFIHEVVWRSPEP